MNLAEILITAYLVIGAFAFTLIWAILIASKRRRDKARSKARDRLEANPLPEHGTKASRFHS